ncbi:hypothetical protein ACF05W_18805 [Streptomyces lydicus]|nr:hypothetical protein [Streptomyces lydicus]UEG91651.1 hypothetical protein LJ741_14460 [Streptomyces lydicus]
MPDAPAPPRAPAPVPAAHRAAPPRALTHHPAGVPAAPPAPTPIPGGIG